MVALTDMYYYPLKSGAGSHADVANVMKYGMTLDRQFMLITRNGEMLTARTHAQILDVTVLISGENIEFQSSMQPPLLVRYSDFTLTPISTAVWDDTFSALQTTSQADSWFSRLLGEDVKLVFNGNDPLRVDGVTDTKLSLADAAPILLLSEESLNYLNEYSSVHNVVGQFRPNFVVKGDLPFAEDEWKTIKIGDVVFDVTSPCARCVFITIDPIEKKAIQGNEPLDTLSKFRRDPESGDVHFGVYLTPLNTGTIQVGASVEVLERKTPRHYPNTLPQRIELVCDEVEPICKDFNTFWFKRADHQPLPLYKAGQHLPIEVKINGEVYHRCYTLSSSPTRADRLSITVKRVPSGTVSNWLHYNLRAGDSLFASLPEGEFFINSQPAGPVIFMTAGSGITPAMSMLRMLSDKNWIGEVVFYYQCQTSADIAFANELQTLAMKHPSLKLVTVVSQPDESWSGLSGRFNESFINLLPDLDKSRIYACGPAGFMDSVHTLLIQHGLPEKNWYQESFGMALTASHREVLSVNIKVNGVTFIGNNQEPILLQAEKAGIKMACSCRAGVCGKCKVHLASGKVEQPKTVAITDEDIQAGYILACSSIPLEDISIE